MSRLVLGTMVRLVFGVSHSFVHCGCRGVYMRMLASGRWRNGFRRSIVPPSVIPVSSSSWHLVLHAIVLRAHRDRLDVNTMSNVLRASPWLMLMVGRPIGAKRPGLNRHARAARRLYQALYGRDIDHVGMIAHPNDVISPVKLRARYVRVRPQRLYDRVGAPNAIDFTQLQRYGIFAQRLMGSCTIHSLTSFAFALPYYLYAP